MMKLVSILSLCLLAISCGHVRYPIYREPPKARELSHVEKMEVCIFRMIEKNGIESKNAQEVCTHIYRRK